MVNIPMDWLTDDKRDAAKTIYIPLIFQVTVIKKGYTECYECQPKPARKSYPGCTIRNTPSEPVHCIVWAKHLFNQLFGEYDDDNEVSPDTEDPELAGEVCMFNSPITVVALRTG